MNCVVNGYLNCGLWTGNGNVTPRHWIRGSRVQTRPRSMDFSERKNPEYDFIRKGSKAMRPVS